MSTSVTVPSALVKPCFSVSFALKGTSHLAAKMMAFWSTRFMSGVTVSPDPFTNPPVLVRTQLSRLPFVTLPVSTGTSHPAIVSLYSGLMGIFGSASSLAAAEITGTFPGLLVGSPAHLRHIVHAGCSRFGSTATLLVAPSAMTPAAAAAPTGLTTLLGELCWSLP